MYLNFTDWSQAGSATHHYLDRSAIGTGYRAAPQVFYNAPQRLWYLVYQTGNASYSTNPDISNPNGWSAPRNFYSSMPDIIRQNIGSGYWVDMWVICDSANCYLFSSDDNGHLYRSQTTVGQFPNGFTNTVIAAQDSKFAMFEASNIYKVQGSNQYLLLVEADRCGRPALLPLLDGRQPRRIVVAAGRVREQPVRQVRQRVVPRRHLVQGHQPRRDDPRGLRPDAHHPRLQAAVPVPGQGPQRER